jgi:hypothetical protein
MAGNTLALTERDQRLCLEVQRFGALTREQAMRLGLFRSPTRAKARLKILADHGLLTVRPHAIPQHGVRHVYLPGPALRTPGVRSRLAHVSPLFLAHQLGLVDIRIAFVHHTAVDRWWTDTELRAAKLGLLPDSYVEYRQGTHSYAAFIEYDRGTETQARIHDKVRAYADLAFSGRFERTFGRRYFRLLLIADTPGRLTTLSKTAATVTDKVVRLGLLRDLITQGPLASIWRRPGGLRLEPLTPSP